MGTPPSMWVRSGEHCRGRSCRKEYAPNYTGNGLIQQPPPPPCRRQSTRAPDYQNSTPRLRAGWSLPHFVTVAHKSYPCPNNIQRCFRQILGRSRCLHNRDCLNVPAPNPFSHPSLCAPEAVTRGGGGGGGQTGLGGARPQSPPSVGPQVIHMDSPVQIVKPVVNRSSGREKGGGGVMKDAVSCQRKVQPPALPLRKQPGCSNITAHRVRQACTMAFWRCSFVATRHFAFGAVGYL